MQKYGRNINVAQAKGASMTAWSKASVTWGEQGGREEKRVKQKKKIEQEDWEENVRRSGEQREINNRAKCEDRGHSFQQTLLKPSECKGGSGTGRGHVDQGQLRLGINVCVCMSHYLRLCATLHNLETTWLLYVPSEMLWLHIWMTNQHLHVREFKQFPRTTCRECIEHA